MDTLDPVSTSLDAAPSSDPTTHTVEARRLLEAGPILLYDGNCGVCSSTIQWILRQERRHFLRFAPLEEKLGQTLRRLAGVAPEVDSLLWVELREGSVHADLRSTAALRVANYVGGFWRLLAIFWLIPRFIRDFAYDTFARHRLQIASPSCLLPTQEERARFVEL